jgi:hypothetical protein
MALLATTRVEAAPELAVYRGAGCDGAKRVPEFEKWLGRPVQRVVDFLDGRNWEHMRGSSKWIGECWKKTSYKLALSIPMLTQDKSATLADGARGKLDQHFVEIARVLVAQGHEDAILRIGWEFNGSWYPWAAERDPLSFVAFWRRIALAMRSVPGNRFRFDWNPTTGLSFDVERAYPGDDVVDIIGLDVYNQSWHPERSDPKARWQEKVSGRYGLEWHRAFARAHNKPRSFPEWGTGTRPDGHGFGDDPTFIANMRAWIAAEGVAYHGYWDFRAPDFDGQLSSNAFPKAGAKFRELFGTQP